MTSRAMRGVGEWPAWYRRSVTIVRLLLAVQFLLNGLNWYYKILPFPSILDDHTGPPKDPIVGGMIASGWAFGFAKAIEILTGLSLLFNLYVPLMLAVSLPVALMTFLVDAAILDAVLGWLQGTVSFQVMFVNVLDMLFFGGVILLMQGYLMLFYLDHYRPMLVRRGGAGGLSRSDETSLRPVWRRLIAVFGVLALGFGIFQTLWMAGMVKQWAIPWSSLKIMSLP